MLLHSKTLYRLYPAQTWLTNLKESPTFTQDCVDKVSQPVKFNKPQNTAYRLRQLEAVEQSKGPLGQLLDLFHKSKAA